jgi:hypothetical protein
LVIFCVALVEAMRTRMSLSDAISQFTPAIRFSTRPQTSFVFVMPGLVPGIHVLIFAHVQRRGWPGQARP